MLILIALISGLLFGTGMIVSNMVDPSKVIAFLDVTGHWDPSLAFVIIGALTVFAPCYHLIIKKRKHAINGDTFSYPSKTSVDSKLILGATCFGIGWGIAGLCPGPVLTSISSGASEIFIFIISMAVGMGIATKVNK